MTPEELPDEAWPEVRRCLKTEGVSAAIDHVQTFAPALRRKLYAGHQKIWGEKKNEKDLDDFVAWMQAGIEEGLRQSGAASDAEEKDRLKDFSNVLSYNLSAGLADCWPEDETPRAQRHLEAGLEAAEQCIRFRTELGKGPFPFSIAHWARGAHHLFLGHVEEAADDFQKSLDYAEAAAREQGASPEISEEGTFGVIVAAGYLGLARARRGDPEGMAIYRQACAAFEAQESNPEKRDDASFGLGQLRKVETEYSSERSPD